MFHLSAVKTFLKQKACRFPENRQAYPARKF